MKRNMESIKGIAGLVVARQGSKSIKDKNLQPIGGVPMICHSFRAAWESGVLERTVVSTDSAEIIDLARQNGVDAPFVRPSELAGDDVHVMEATLHAVRWLEEHQDYTPDYFMLLQPTSPLRIARDIRAAVAIALQHDADGVVSVVETERHPYLTKTIDEKGRIAPFIDSGRGESRRQELPEVFSLNGCIYLVKRSVLLEEKSWCPKNAYAYVMPHERSLDVDSLWDLEMVRLVYQKINGGGLVGQARNMNEKDPHQATVGTGGR